MLKAIGAFASGSMIYLLSKQLGNIGNIVKSIYKPRCAEIASNLPFDDSSINQLKSSFVVVVGIGGVGSNIILALIKSGINHIRAIDYDLVTLSSLNRHAFATLKDVGTFKSRVVKNYANTVNQHIVIESIDDAFTIADAPLYITKGNPDYVIDCIDNLEAKCDLIHFCHLNNIRIISSMGAAGKCNPSQVRYSMFNNIMGDVLAKRLRFLYKKKHKTTLPNIPSVFSIEKVAKGLSELEEHQKGNQEQYGINANERIRTLPVFACLPAAFGQCLASVVINSLGKNDIISKTDINENDKINCCVGSVSLAKLINDHRLYEMTYKGKKEDELYLCFDDYYRIAKMFNFVSSISNKSGNKMKFIRWRIYKEPSIDNIVIMNKSELNMHYNMKTEEDLLDSYGTQFVKEIDTKLSSLILNKE